MPRRNPTRKPRALRRKNIRRKTGAKSQAKQIAALSSQLSKLNRVQYETVRTYWQRNSLPVETVATPGYPYMCPIPRMAMDPADQYAPGSGLTNTWTDTLAVASQPSYSKKVMFGCSDNALKTGTLFHTGGTLKYQLSCNDDDMTKATIALISLKSAAADQKTVDNGLRFRTTPPFGPSANSGQGAPVKDGTDYIIHNGAGSSDAGVTSFGTVINRQYWNVHYQRECTFGHIGAGGIANNINPSNTRPANNSLVATGTIKIPAYGEIKSFATNPTPTQVVGQNAMELGLYDEQQEKALYLIVISNGVTLDNQGLYLGLLGTDYYRAVV